MLNELLETSILEQFSGLKKSPKGWLVTNCPLCVHRGHNADQKGRFGLKFPGDGQIGVSCFNCAFKAKYVPGTLLSRDFVWFLGKIGIPPDDIKKLKFQAFREKEAGAIFEAPKLRGNLFHKWTPIDLPEDAHPVMTWLNEGCKDKNLLQAVNYAMDRGVNPDDIYWSPDSFSQYNKRFILPYYFRGKIVGFTARYTKDVTSKTLARYINKMPDGYVYNLDAQQDFSRKYCLVHEGTIDAYITGGISCLGSINQDQISIINSLGKEVIVCPDRDSAGEHLVEAALEQGWKVSFPNWAPHVKDAGKAAQVYGRLLTVQSLIESAEKNKLKIHVSRKMDKFI